MRTVRMMGEMESTPFGDKAVNCMPFKVLILPDEWTPDTTTRGEFAYLNPPNPFPRAYCISGPDDVDGGDLCALFGRMNRWSTSIGVTGTYDDLSGGAPKPFVFGRTLSIGVRVDRVNEGFAIDERFLPHGRTNFLNFSDYTSYPGELVCSASLGIDASGINPADETSVMKPQNSLVPLKLFDTSDTNTFIPIVSYSRTVNGWYMYWGGGIDMTVFFNPISSGYSNSYNFGLVTGPMPEGGGTQFINGVDYPQTVVEGPQIQLYPLPPIPSYIIYPEGLGSIINTAHLRASPSVGTSHFEFRDSDGNNPIWSKSTGARLITPVPMGMD